MLKKVSILAGAVLAAATMSAPAQAAELPRAASAAPTGTYFGSSPLAPLEQAHHKRGHRPKGHFKGRGNPQRYRYPVYTPRDRYGERVYYDTRVWRGDDGRYYCRRSDGTTGLLIGAAVGGLIGREIAGDGDRTLGTIIGAVGGAIVGREIERDRARCR